MTGVQTCAPPISGSLAEIAKVIADSDGNISNLSITAAAPDFSDMTIDLEVFDLKHLTRIVAELRGIAVVSHAVRVNG